MINSTLSPSRYFGMNRQGFSAADKRGRHTVGNVKIALSEKIALLWHPQCTFRAVWLLRNLTLDCKLCVRNEKNADWYNFTIPCEHGKRHTMRAQKSQAVSDWLNPLSLLIHLCTICHNFFMVMPMTFHVDVMT